MKKRHRLILLLGSLAFGLIVTNIVYLWGDHFNETDNKITETAEGLPIIDQEINIAGQSLSPKFMGILWTVGKRKFCLTP